MTPDPSRPPDQAPTITRWPAAPIPDGSLPWLVGFGVLFFGFGALLVSPLIPKAEDGVVVLYTFGSMGLLAAAQCAWFAMRAHRERQEFPARMQAYLEARQRLLPAWARVDKSDFGATRVRAGGDDPDVLIGYEMHLELTLWLPDDTLAGYRATATRTQVTCRHDIQLHVTPLLVAGTWIEVAYDPLQGSVLPQRLLSREGAAIPLESVR